jgi:hypothetical protein
MSQVKMVLNNAGTVSLVTSRQISLTHNTLLPNRNMLEVVVYIQKSGILYTLYTL